ITVYAWLRVATSLMTVLAGWRLRVKQPELPRAFLVPGGRLGMAYAVLAPIVMGAIAIAGSVASSGRFVLTWAPVAILFGPIAYLFLGRNPKALVIAEKRPG